MKLALSKSILYLITPGATAEGTTADSPEFHEILTQISAAVAAGIDLVQIREKKLDARVLFKLSERATELTRGTATRVLVNDRADIAAGAAADGVHLTTRSMAASTIRKTFGEDFLIGVSTHTLAEALAARDGGADFAVFGPVFETRSKVGYGPGLGTGTLAQVCDKLKPFPILALGGVSKDNADECLKAGAAGLAGINIFRENLNLRETCAALRQLPA